MQLKLIKSPIIINLIILIFLITTAHSCQDNKEPIEIKLEKEVKIEGIATIKTPDQNTCIVSPLYEGNIEKLILKNGDSIQKGDVIALFYNQEILILQGAYLSCKNELEYLKEEYKRQGDLTVENIASIKKMQEVKSKYLSKEAIYRSLKLQLEKNGLNTNQINKKGYYYSGKIIAKSSGKLHYNGITTGSFLKKSSDNIYITTKDTLEARIAVDKNLLPQIPEQGIFELYAGPKKICDANFKYSDLKEFQDNFILFAQINHGKSKLFEGQKLYAILKK